jgi:hypothetical protein
MKARIYRIIYTGDPVPPERRRRQWLDIGESMVIAGFILIPMAAAAGNDPHIELFSAAGKTVGVCPMMPMTFSAAGPYAVIPRALRYSPGGTVTAVLLETQYTGSDKPGWDTQQEDDCNANIQPLPDRR